MIDNSYIECNFCQNIINLRTQIGYYSVPFYFNCPECTGEISGEVSIDNESMNISVIELVNANLANDIELYSEDYFCVELAAEFMTTKPKIRSEVPIIGPFMSSTHLFKEFNIKSQNYVAEARIFADFPKGKWKELMGFQNLLRNKKNSVLFKKLNEILLENPYIPFKTVKSRIDAISVMHQYLIISTGLLTSLDSKTVKAIMSLQHIDSSNYNHLINTASYLNINEKKLIEIEKKAIDLIDKYRNFYVHILPVVVERKADNFEFVDLDNKGISTVSYQQLMNFYASSFEWILDKIDIIIVLNNFRFRGRGDLCANGKKYAEIEKLYSRFLKLDFYDDSENKGLVFSSLKNKIRNGIQHFDTYIDYNNQIVTFTNTNRSGKTTEEIMYFSEFANLCIDNFSIIVYMNEIIYRLRQYEIIKKEGKRPSL